MSEWTHGNHLKRCRLFIRCDVEQRTDCHSPTCVERLMVAASRNRTLLVDDRNSEDRTALFLGESIRKLFSAGLRFTRQHRLMLQTMRTSLRHGTIERAAVVREIRRCVRLERAATSM